MSTVFDVPCPDCGRQMAIGSDGDLQCPPCEKAYRLRMGHLFPIAESAPSQRPEGAADAATAAPS
jgi:hypothetical protein